MNFNIDIDASKINDQNHLINLHNHITRTAKKYEPIKSKVFINILKSDTENLKYNPNLIHIIIQAESHDFDNMDITHEIFKKREKLEQDVLQIIGQRLIQDYDKIKELTIVSGAQPDGTYIAPCIHIIYEAENETGQPDLSNIISTLEVLDYIISQI